mmetsp:Transcript_14470/g.43757  ORF Transcript_14470/g.43757 Transcript_14470/m.43757 type:complete len:906 (-) Transcript_14470:1020-3737(-)
MAPLLCAHGMPLPPPLHCTAHRTGILNTLNSRVVRPFTQLRSRRAPRLVVLAHGSHSHNHPHRHSHSHSTKSSTNSGGGTASPTGSLSSRDAIADELLGSAENRKGAAAVTALSLDATASEDGQHSHSHGDHDHGHAPVISNPLHRVLLWIYSHTGILQLADVLRENTCGSIAISVFFACAAISHWQAGGSWLAAQLGERICTVSTAMIYFLAGVPAAVDLTFDLTALHIDTHVLMTLAVLGTLAIGGALEGALLLVLFQVSHTVEHKLTDRAQGDLTSLFDSVPESATLVNVSSSGEPDMDSQCQENAGSVEVGASMLVKPGEQVPLDGDIIFGEALVSMQHITGEALPTRRGRGATIPAGSQNHDGLLVLRVTNRADDSTPARISRLAADAQASKPQLRRWIDQVGEVYSKVVIVATVASLVVLRMQGVPMLSTATQRGAMYRAMGLLTTASPCALVLVPLAYVSAIAAITSRGMLIKGGKVLDALNRCKTVAFDKTGTLTTGQLACTGVASPASPASSGVSDASDTATSPTTTARAPSEERKWLDNLLSEGDGGGREALAVAAALSDRSNHPVSKAVTALRKQVGGKLPKVDVVDFKLVPGAGAQGTVQGSGDSSGGRGGTRHVRFGSAKFAAEVLPAEQARQVLAQAKAMGTDRVVSVVVQSTAHATADSYGSGALVRLLSFRDTLNQRSMWTVKALRTGWWPGGRASHSKHAVNVTMLTGDTQASADYFAQQLGISDVRAGLAPEDKLSAIQKLRSGNGSSSGVLMVGDGINDTPALAAADVGVAIAANARDGAGSASDIVILTGGGVAALPFLLAVARRTRNIVYQNMALALGSIAVLAPSVLAGEIPLWGAVTMHEGSTLLVALNCLRLLKWPSNAVPTEDIVTNEDGTELQLSEQRL